MKFDLNFICKNLGNLTAIPTRLYKNKKLIEVCMLIDWPCDPIKLCLEGILTEEHHIYVHITPKNQYYGIVRHREYRLVIGPTSQAHLDNQTLTEIAFLLSIENEKVNEFISAIHSIPCFSIQNFIQILIMINYTLNGEKANMKDILIKEGLQIELGREINEKLTEQEYNQQLDNLHDVHNTFAYEQTMLNYVKRGDTLSLKKFIQSSFHGTEGRLATENIRQHKNTFVVAATLISRAAIRGGMLSGDAFKLSDEYIQRSELLNNVDMLSNLQYTMILDYTERVAKLSKGESSSTLVLSIKNHIKNHISENFSTSDLAKLFFISREYMCTKFKKETGITINNYILAEKIEEAKRLLSYTNKSIAAISNYLGFSSQSHFQNTFKKLVGETPKMFHDKNFVK